MSDIGGIKNVGGDPLISSLYRQQQGGDLLVRQQHTQEQTTLQVRETGAITDDGNSSFREQKRNNALE
jgi:hypothetical protein